MDETPFGLVWSMVVEGDVRYVEAAGANRAWARVADPGGGPDGVVLAHATRPTEFFESQVAAVNAMSSTIMAHGTVRDFFAVDQSTARIWVGARYLGSDGSWRVVAQDGTVAGGMLRLDTRALLDDVGRPAVPWSAWLDCPQPGGCQEDGLIRFKVDGEVVDEIRFEPAPGADRDELPVVHLLQGEGSVGVPLAISRRGIYALRDVISPRVDPPPLTGPDGIVNAGYVTAAASLSNGEALVVVWVERRDRPTLVHELVVLAYGDQGWRVLIAPEIMAASPIVTGDLSFDRIVAADSDSSGLIWLASNAPALAAWDPDAMQWLAAWSDASLGLPDDALLRDVSVSQDGTVWLATSHGLALGSRPLVGQVYVPFGSGFRR